MLLIFKNGVGRATPKFVGYYTFNKNRPDVTYPNLTFQYYQPVLFYLSLQVVFGEREGVEPSMYYQDL